MTQWTAETILKALSENHEKLRELGAVKLGLFGSYARGEQRPESDMDFLVTLVESKFGIFMDILNFLEDFFECQIDLGEENLLRDELRKNVMREVIYVPELQAVSQ